MKAFFPHLRNFMLLLVFATGSAQALDKPASGYDGIANVVAMRRQSLVNTDTFIDRRVAFEKLMARWPIPAGVKVHSVNANGVGGKWFSPVEDVGSAHGVILYLHGGGFYSGSSDSHRVLAATLAKDAHADVLLIDYRRLPEAVYPAQIDDAYSSYQWLLKRGYPASKIAIAGESVGGNLALELALRLRDAHEPLPSSIVAMSPVTDLTASGASVKSNVDRDPLLKRDGLISVARAYMASADPSSPKSSPLFADLHGFPPLLLQVGSREILLDDSLRIARVAAEDDVPVSVEIWPGMVHQWQLFPTVIPDARRALEDDGKYIQKNMAREGEAR